MEHDGHTRQREGEEDLLKHKLIVWRIKKKECEIGLILSSHGAQTLGSIATQLGRSRSKTPAEFPWLSYAPSFYTGWHDLVKLHGFAEDAALAGQSVSADFDRR
jgi:hypothetical protein